MTKTFPPEFTALMAQYRDTSAGLGDDHPITRRLWLIVATTAPDWFQDEMHQMAKSLDLMPEPFGCDDSGQKFYSLDALAVKLGVSEEDMRSHLADLQAEAAAVGLKGVLTGDAGTLHRLH